MQTWLAPPRESFTEAQVREAISLDNRSPKRRWGVDVLDEHDIPTGETIQVESGEVAWSYRPPDRVTGQTTEVADVRRQASLVVAWTSVPLATRRFRIWTEWLGTVGWVRFHHGVFLPTVPPMDDDGTVIRYRLSLADKMYRLANSLLTETLTVPAGANVVGWVKSDMTSRFGETAFAITSSDVILAEAKAYEAGTSLLEVYNSLLKTAAFDDLSADENGRPSSTPLDTIAGKGSEHSYGPGEGKIVTPASVEPLLPTLPNVVRFVARQGPSLAEVGNGIAVRTNQSTGPASIDQRGVEVELRVEVDAENQAELESIADADAQRYFAGGGDRLVVKVGLNPRMGDRDVVSVQKPRLGLSGVWNVTSWRLPLQPIDSEAAVLMDVTLERKVAVS